LKGHAGGDLLQDDQDDNSGDHLDGGPNPPTQGDICFANPGDVIVNCDP
jgi:hypothetical protein